MLSSFCIVGAVVLACGGESTTDPMSSGERGGTGGTASGGVSAGGGSSGAGDDAGAPFGGSSAGGENNDAGAPSGGSSAAGSGGVAAAAGSGGKASGPPPDNRPPRPAWDPPIPIGEPGWEESTSPLCETNQGSPQAFDVWADDRGVYTFFLTGCNPLGRDPCEGTEGAALHHNDGTGWEWLLDPGILAPRLSGLPGGPIVISGQPGTQPGLQPGEAHGPAGIYFLEEDGSLTLSHPLEHDGSAEVFGVASDRAYALDGPEVLEYRDGVWHELETVEGQPLALWADESTLVVVGLDQMVLMRTSPDEPLRRLEDVPAGHYTAVWGFGPDDLWLGNGVEQLIHYDGATFEIFDVGNPDSTDKRISALWGDAGVVYFTTPSAFGRADRDGVEVLFAREPDAARTDPYFGAVSLWGRSANEVFLTLFDGRFTKYACGESFIVWFDGEEFHQF
ncbi:MAG: hypothetical protein DIU78_012465 [Pseudomonadota bacterium]